jgi:hypothetical protein
MAQLIGLNVYQINSMDALPSASVPRIDFPFAGIMVRGINAGAGLQLSTGAWVYGQVQLVSTGSVYLVGENPAQIAALS